MVQAAARQVSTTRMHADAGTVPEFSQGWVLFAGAMFVFVALKRALHPVHDRWTIMTSRPFSRLDAMAVVFVIKEGLYRAGSWAVKPRG